MNHSGSREWLRGNAHWVAFILMSFALGVVLTLTCTGCANAYDNAQIAKGAAARALGESSLAWLEYDRQHQRSIVALDIPKPEREEKLSAWRAQVQAPIVEGFHMAEEALRELDRELKNWRAGLKDGLSGALAALWRSLGHLTELLKKHGVSIPLPGGTP